MKQNINQLKPLQRIHSAMLAGMVLFCVVSAAVRLPGRFAADASLNKVLQVTILALTFIFLKTGLSVFDRKLQAIPVTALPAEKLAAYRLAAIINWALIEIPVLLAVVFFMFTRNYAFIVLAFGLVIFFALQGPSKLKIMLQLKLTEQEATLLEGVSE